MTDTTFAQFSICLQCMPCGTAPKWGPGVARYYMALLRPIQDSDAEALMIALGSTPRTFRPDPAEILALWRQLTAPAKAMTAMDAVAAIYRAIDEPQYVDINSTEEVFVADPGQEDKIAAVKAHIMACIADGVRLTPCPGVEITGHYETRQTVTQCRTFREPKAVKNDPILSSIVAAMGGWASICTGPGIGTPAGVFRGQLRRVAEAVIAGEGDNTINALRLEYQSQRLLPAETPMMERS